MNKPIQELHHERDLANEFNRLDQVTPQLEDQKTPIVSNMCHSIVVRQELPIAQNTEEVRQDGYQEEPKLTYGYEGHKEKDLTVKISHRLPISRSWLKLQSLKLELKQYTARLRLSGSTYGDLSLAPWSKMI